MKLERDLAIIAAAACTIPLALWMFNFWTPSYSHQYQDWAAFGDFVGGLLSPLLAFVSFLGLLVTIKHQRAATARQQQDADSSHYFKHAVQSMERAFNTLSDNGTSQSPVHDRLVWLTCARLLLSAEQSSRMIALESVGLRKLFEGEQEYWRHRFYEFLEPLSPQSVGKSTQYFQQDATAYRSPIEERSIRVIYEFLQWPEDKDDPIDEVPKYTKEELDRMRVGMVGVRTYVMSLPRFTKHE